MNMELAADYIRRRMNELGHGDSYYTRIRHLVLQPGEVRIIAADNQLLVLTEPVEMITVQSEFGVFDLAAWAINELQYEHQGKVSITNHSATLKHIPFIQVIPKTSTICN